MIPREWLGEETTVEEIEKRTVLDREGLDSSMVVETGDPWWNKSIYENDQAWNMFKHNLQEGDKIHKWAAPFRSFVMNGTQGYAIVREGVILFIYTEPR